MALSFTTGNTFAAGDVVTATKMNAQVNSSTYTGTLEVAKGGTGSATAADARTALSVPESSTVMLKANNLSDLANAATARTNLGVAASSATLLVANNLSDVANASTARSNLGIESPVANSSQLDRTDNTYTDIPGLTLNLTSGTTYTVETLIPFSVSSASMTGFKITGTATGSSVAGVSFISYSNGGSTGALLTKSITAIPTTVPCATTNQDTGYLHASVTIVCNGSGTIKWQFAGNSGTSSALLGAWMKLYSY